jgi:hypothetical protein
MQRWLGFASLYPLTGIIPLSGKHGGIGLLARLAAADPMRHDRAENIKAAGNAALTGRPS